MLGSSNVVIEPALDKRGRKKLGCEYVCVVVVVEREMYPILSYPIRTYTLSYLIPTYTLSYLIPTYTLHPILLITLLTRRLHAHSQGLHVGRVIVAIVLALTLVPANIPALLLALADITLVIALALALALELALVCVTMIKTTTPSPPTPSPPLFLTSPVLQPLHHFRHCWMQRG